MLAADAFGRFGKGRFGTGVHHQIDANCRQRVRASIAEPLARSTHDGGFASNPKIKHLALLLF